MIKSKIRRERPRSNSHGLATYMEPEISQVDGNTTNDAFVSDHITPIDIQNAYADAAVQALQGRISGDIGRVTRKASCFVRKSEDDPSYVKRTERSIEIYSGTGKGLWLRLNPCKKLLMEIKYVRRGDEDRTLIIYENEGIRNIAGKPMAELIEHYKDFESTRQQVRQSKPRK